MTISEATDRELSPELTLITMISSPSAGSFPDDSLSVFFADDESSDFFADDESSDFFSDDESSDFFSDEELSAVGVLAGFSDVPELPPAWPALSSFSDAVAVASPA